MNKQVTDKIKFMLWGLTSRINENKDYINSITFVYKSGLKEYKGIYNCEKELVNFNGKDEKLAVDGIPEFIANNSLNYDSLEFIIDERGKSTVLYADNKNVKTKQVDSIEDEKSDKPSGTSQILNRKYFLKIGEADNLLREIGILTKEGKVKNGMIRKYNQIDHFIELIDGLIEDMMDLDTITILDCGCGKSYLTFALNYYIKEKKKKNCYFIGIDRSKKVIKASNEIAKKLGYKNMEFVEGDINEYEPKRRIDGVISLHACDIATDMALGMAVKCEAKTIMCVPCCHKELLEQYKPSKDFEPLFRQGIFKSRFADTLTDSLRCLLLQTQGYEVSAVEYISPLETPKNLLIKARKTSDKNYDAAEEYENIRNMLGVYPYLESLIELY